VTAGRLAPRTTHRVRVRRRRVLGLLVAVVALATLLGGRWPGSSPSPSTSWSSSTPAASSSKASTDSRSDALGEDGGAIPEGTTIFDAAIPGVAKLDPAFLDVLRRAATDARAEGVTFVVDSGWRSEAYQRHLLDEAIDEYGSAAEAARWVASPDTSEHVKGEAIDLGRDAAGWLSAHGAAYGLCRIYENESWHFERRPDAVAAGCPPMYADPTQDPRMRR
jgi:D-alanyl-D-alanine carboxypeptidase